MKNRYFSTIIIYILTVNLTPFIIGQVENDYEQWKVEQQAAWQEAGKTSLEDQAVSLIDSAHYWLEDIKKDPEHSQYSERQVLYHYNYTRELLGEGSVSRWQDINESWLNEQRYKAWKTEQQTKWQERGKTYIHDQVKEMIDDAKYWLEGIKKNPEHSQYSEQQALYSYNYARELLGKSSVSRWQDTDESWLDEQRWRAEREEGWLETETLLRKLSSLMSDINYHLTQLSRTPSDTKHQRQAKYVYNFLRELLSRDTIESFLQIDKEWLAQVQEELVPYAYRESEAYSAPTFAQTQLLEQARKVIRLPDIMASSYRGGGESDYVKPGLYSVALPETPDSDAQLSTLYHELGHIVYKDPETRRALLVQDDNYDQILKDVRLKRVRERVQKYLELGKKAFDKSTPLGGHVVDILSRYPMIQFWQPPEELQGRQETQCMREQEERADLFAIEKLLQNQKMDAILQDVVGFGYKDVIADTFDEHPSGFERALYMTGFLVDNGIDINKALQQWYATGKCTMIQPGVLDLLQSMQPKSQGAQDIIKVYKQWQEEQERNNYEQWKAEEQEDWESEGKTSLQDQTWSLINGVYEWLDYIRQDPEHDQYSEQQALYNYNYARELLEASTASKWQDIDESWLDEQRYKGSRVKQEEKWMEEGDKTNLQDQATALINDASYLLV